MAKRIFVLFLFLFAFVIGNTQCILKHFKGYTYCIHTEDTVSGKIKLTCVPQFPGDINQWFSDNIEYPEPALDAMLQGTVYLGFTVEKDSSISNLKVLRGVNKYLDDEALKTASKMPKWTPGKIHRRAEAVPMFLFIRFVIRDVEIPPVRAITQTVFDSERIHQH